MRAGAIQGLKRHLILSCVSYLFLSRMRQEFGGKKNPELTVCQVYTAMAALVRLWGLSFPTARGEVLQKAAAKIRYTQHRKAQARKSHWKQALERLRQFGITLFRTQTMHMGHDLRGRIKIRRCDFMTFAEEQSGTLVDSAKRLAQGAGAEYHFLQGYHRKDKLVDEDPAKTAHRRRVDLRPLLHGDLPSFRLVRSNGRPRLANARRPHARALLLLPGFRVGSDLHPHDDLVPVHRPGLCQRPLLPGKADAQAVLGFTRQDNTFTALDDPQAARKLADSFVDLNSRNILNRLVRQVNSLMRSVGFSTAARN